MSSGEAGGEQVTWPVRAIIARGAGDVFVFVAHEGSALDGEIGQGNGPYPDDILPRCDLAGRTGLFVWEGTLRLEPPGPEETHWEPEWRGATRPLTDAEWAALREGREPWPAGAVANCAQPQRTGRDR